MIEYPGRVIKVGESDQAIVLQISSRLKALGYNTASPAGVYDAAFKSLIKLFQAQHVDALNRPLKIDGEIGPLTWGSIFGATTVAADGNSVAKKALAKAITQIGVREDPVGSNRGPKVEEYLGSVGLGGGYFWCMAFVYWCFKQACANPPVANPFPKTAGCIDAWNLTAQYRVTKAKAVADPSLIVPGSVFILDYGGGNGHTGFVMESVGGALRTVEGNTNNDGSNNGIGVFELNRRNIMDRNLKGFIIIH